MVDLYHVAADHSQTRGFLSEGAPGKASRDRYQINLASSRLVHECDIIVRARSFFFRGCSPTMQGLFDCGFDDVHPCCEWIQVTTAIIFTMATAGNPITIVHCWSAPRSRSTALLYSFDARPDCQALDEPLYRPWLLANEGVVTRPYLEYMRQGQGPAKGKGSQANWQRETLSWSERIAQAAQALPAAGGLIFCKHMAKHAPHYDFQHQLEGYNHVHLLLLRDPYAVLSAWGAAGDNHGNVATPNEVGILPLLSIYSTLRSDAGNSKLAVLDADDLVQDPPTVLKDICESLGIPYDEAMLKWEVGPKACDGPFADWWYTSVHKSSGWTVAQDKKYRTLDPSLYTALQASMPAYDYLQQYTYGHRHRGPPPSQKIYEDPRNENLLVYIGAKLRGKGRLIPRQLAGVSPWDSSVQGGDGTWEGLRVYNGKILSLDKHLRRLQRSAKALGFQNVHTSQEITEAIFQTLAANGMRDGAHMRLTLTRGEKCTSSMNPKFNVYGTTLIILPEWKPTEGATTYDNTKGISLITSSLRRNSPSTCDSKIHHNNMINNILPKIQANLANAADAIMLDIEGMCGKLCKSLLLVAIR